MPAAISKLMPPSRGTVHGGGQQGGGPIGGPGGPAALLSRDEKRRTRMKTKNGNIFLIMLIAYYDAKIKKYKVKVLKKYKQHSGKVLLCYRHTF